MQSIKQRSIKCTCYGKCKEVTAKRIIFLSIFCDIIFLVFFKGFLHFFRKYPLQKKVKNILSCPIFCKSKDVKIFLEFTLFTSK